jgi:hypothetical protein
VKNEVITSHMVENRILSKTSPDGIYTDPESGTKYNMNEVHDAADAVLAEMWRLDLKGYTVRV